jgi:hypothetical protein
MSTDESTEQNTATVDVSGQPVKSSSWPESVKTIYALCNIEKEKERFNRLVLHLLVRNIPKERLKMCGPTWGDTLTTDTIFKVYDPYIRRGNLPTFSFKAARLSKGEISLVLNFFSAIQNAAKDLAENESILIIESDVYLRRDFVSRLNDIYTDLSGREWDYISLSEGVGTRPNNVPSSYYSPTKVYNPPHSWVFRCTDSMLLSKRFVDKLCKTLLPFKECLDWELNFQIALHSGIALWADPPLVEQGTCFSRESTSLP